MPTASAQVSFGALGLALLFVLFTYGGWNEAAYISGEVKNPGRNMIRILVFGLGAVAVIYVLMNIAYLHVLGLEGNKLSVHYQGACGSCPSSISGTLTGIENLVRQIEPEIEVVAV